MQDSKTKRYPGARPFRDSPLERKLFFGRKDEQKKLLHFILSKDIVILFAKSGVGKSSLLNAGVFENLNKRNYFPVSIRLNSPSVSVLDSIESHIVEVAHEKNVEFIPKRKDSLREFLKASEIWTEDDKLMTPVLVFDQFEEIFTLDYTEEQRKDFFKQLADLGKVKRKLSQNKEGSASRYYLDSPPKVKIVLSLREEFLAQLEEISEDIPSILHHRFRLEALTEDQAIDAIESPAELNDENLSSRKFNYSEDAIKAITNFLMKKDLRERLKIMTKTWDPKWPRWILFIFAALLIPITLWVNISDTGEVILAIVLWLVYPLFIFSLAIRKPIPGRNTIVPIILLYAWFFLLIFFTNISQDFLEYELLGAFIGPTIIVLTIVSLICFNYRKGRNEVLNQSGPASKEINYKRKKWPKRLLLYLFVWIVGSTIISGLINFGEEIIMLNYAVILIYFIVLSVKFPIPTRKYAILPLIGAFILNPLMSFLVRFDDTLGIFLLILLIVSILCPLFTLMLIAPLWTGYSRGLKSVDLKVFEKLGKSTEKIEPFQLQLICQNIENKVLLKQHKKDGDKEEITIKEKDFGGDAGMHRILLKFYDDQLNKVSWKIRRKVRRLCERGLISVSGRRLSIAEDDIVSRFKLKKERLFELVEYRLLRAEKRLGNKYYEISHDTLLQPILTSATKHINRNMGLKWAGYISGLLLVLYGINFYNSLTDPASPLIYEQMDKSLSSETEIHQAKIENLTLNLNQLDKRDRFNWLLKSIQTEDDEPDNDKQFYKSKLEHLKKIDQSLLKLDEVAIIDSTEKKLESGIYKFSHVSKAPRFSILPLKEKSNSKEHKLEIEWHYKRGYYDDRKLQRKIELVSKSTDTITLSFDISKLHVRGYNELYFYESDSINPSKRYLLKIFRFEAKLENIKEP